MADLIAVTGRVATEPRRVERGEGAALVTFRLATSDARFDEKTRSWVDREPNFYTVNAWGPLAANAEQSLATGQQVLVRGRLERRGWTDANGGKRIDPTIQADGIGHDLRRGTTVLTAVPSRARDGVEARAEAEPAWAPPGESVDLPF